MRTKLLIAFVLFAVSTWAADQGEYDAIAQRIEKEIKEEDKVQIEDLKVTHFAGTVFLEGVTDRYGSRHVAGEIASKSEGIKEVKNEIAVRAGEVSDAEIETDLTQKVQKHFRGSPFDLVAVRVNRGFVTLEGNVRDTTLRQKTFEDAMWLRGVRGVENKIQLASVSSGDERLRRILYDRIRREFPQYFLGKFPSILIIVNSGRVSLFGQVESNASRQKIVSIVRSTTGVLSVESQIQAP